MNRFLLAAASALILLVAWLTVATLTPSSSPENVVDSRDIPSPRSRRVADPSPMDSTGDLASMMVKKARRPIMPPSDREIPKEPPSGNDPTTPPELRRAAEFRQALRRGIEEYEDASGSTPVLQPAVFLSHADDPSLPPAHHEGIQQIAKEFEDKLADSGLDPASPEYRRLWNQAVRESDWKFRARYGARAWSRQHIRAHHLANSPESRSSE